MKNDQGNERLVHWFVGRWSMCSVHCLVLLRFWDTLSIVWSATTHKDALKERMCTINMATFLTNVGGTVGGVSL